MRLLPAAVLVLASSCTAERIEAPLHDTASPMGTVWVSMTDAGPDTAPMRQVVDLDTPQGALRLDLVRNDQLFSPGYQELRLDASGVALPHPPTDWANARPCYYTGDVLDDEGRWIGRAAVQTCDQTATGRLSGLITVDDTLWSVAPAPIGSADARVAHDLSPVTTQTMEALDLPTADFATLPFDATLPLAGPPDFRFVEYLVVNDAARQATLGAATETQTAAIANAVDGLYAAAPFNAHVRVTLTSQVTLVSDPWTVPTVGGETDAVALLSAFDTWALTHDVPEHDARHLFSGRNLTGTTVGYQTLGGVCQRALAGGVVQTTWPVGNSAVIAAHELGHGFGMAHDGTGAAVGCDPNAFIMASFACTTCTPLSAFSGCSVTSFNAFLAAGNAACLLDRPTATFSGPTCGDAVVEGDEECDCGGADCALVDPCCDGATCTLAAGATCSALDGCCDPSSCSVVPASAQQVCRHDASSCDEPEVCDGVSAACPADIVRPSGDTCTDPLGFDGACYDGECVSYPTQCRTLTGWGGPYVEEDTCLGYWGDPCVELSCALPFDPTNTCYWFEQSPGVSLPLADGTPCGNGLQCLDSTCVPSADLDATIDFCPNDPDKTAPGVCGCGTPDIDLDGDGTPDCGPVFVDTCGDSVVDANEACDDGNSLPYDACDACQRTELLLDALTPGVSGVRNTFRARHIAPGSRVWFVVSSGPGSLNVPGCPGLVLPIRPPMAALPSIAAADGTSSTQVGVPPTVAGRTVHLVAVDTATCRASAVRTTTFP